MPFREKVSIQLVLLVARWLAPSELGDEIKKIATHLQVWSEKLDGKQ